MANNLKLFEHPLSPYAQKVKLALREKQLEFGVQMPGFGSDAAVAEFAALSPRREVPLLVHRDVVLFESPVILNYIEETWPDPPLLPTSAAARSKARLIENAIDTHFEANTWGLAEVLVFGRAEGKLAEQLTQYAEQEIHGWFRWLNEQLESQAWFNGTAFGYADICVIPFVNGAGRFDLHPEPTSELGEWVTRANCRETVKQTQTEAAAAELDPTMMKAALAAGFQREYRDHRLEWMIRAGGLSVVQEGLAADNIRFNDAFQTS